jgi:hypothetical protein
MIADPKMRTCLGLVADSGVAGIVRLHYTQRMLSISVILILLASVIDIDHH